jgi:hypothetical protein
MNQTTIGQVLYNLSAYLRLHQFPTSGTFLIRHHDLIIVLEGGSEKSKATTELTTRLTTRRISFTLFCILLEYLAERKGFEPSIRVNVYTLSRGAPSATRPPLRAKLVV